MPKLKTRRAAAKRFKRSGSGKWMRRQAFRNHNFEYKPTARKRRLGYMAPVNERDAESVSLMLPHL